MSLQKVRDYKNESVVARLQRELGLSEEDAEALFEDVKGFLYLSSLSKGPISPTKKLDAGWHEFILFTRDYREFCMECVGHFVDHVPTNVEIAGQYLDRTTALAREHLGVSSDNWVGGATFCTAKCMNGPQPDPQPKDADICEAWPPQPKPEMVAQHHQHA